MNGHKRKAVEQLTRNSVVVHQPLPPTPASGAMGAVMSTMAHALTGLTRWIYGLYSAPKYTDMTYQSGEIVTDTHVQFSSPRNDGNSAIKRSKHKHPQQEAPRSRSLDSGNRNNGCGTLDISGCSSEGEVSKRVNDFWAPPEFGRVRKSTTNASRAILRSPKGLEDEGPGLYRSHDGALVSRMTPERSSSPQSDGNAPDVDARKVAGPMPTTPESLPYDDMVISKGSTEPVELVERLSKLLGPEESEQDSSLTLSGFVNKRRQSLAQERKIKERRDAIRAAKEIRLHRRQPRRALVQPLEFEWNDVVDRIIYSNDHQRIITTSIGGTELRLKDFATLLGKRSWLNDEIINTYIEWAVDAANNAAAAQMKALGEPASTVPKFIAHNSFFYENLIKKGPSSTQGLMRRKKAPGISLMEVDSVFVPICKGSHWTVGVVRPIAKTIEYFDSMGGNPQPFVKLMRDWLKFQLGETYVESEWKTPRTACAPQTNGYDCGVFVCTNALCVALGLDTLCYNERDMMQQRRNIAAVLVNRGFIGDFAWSGGGL